MPGTPPPLWHGYEEAAEDDLLALLDAHDTARTTATTRRYDMPSRAPWPRPSRGTSALKKDQDPGNYRPRLHERASAIAGGWTAVGAARVLNVGPSPARDEDHTPEAAERCGHLRAVDPPERVDLRADWYTVRDQGKTGLLRRLGARRLGHVAPARRGEAAGAGPTPLATVHVDGGEGDAGQADRGQGRARLASVDVPRAGDDRRQERARRRAPLRSGARGRPAVRRRALPTDRSSTSTNRRRSARSRTTTGSTRTRIATPGCCTGGAGSTSTAPCPRRRRRRRLRGRPDTLLDGYAPGLRIVQPRRRAGRLRAERLPRPLQLG